MATVRDFVRMDLPPQSHVYDDPSLSPLEFLQAVMHATHLPMSFRIDAARGLLPYTEPPPGPRPTNSFPRCAIVIGGISDDCARATDHGSVAKDPEQINTISQSKSSIANNNHHPQSGDPGPLYIEENPEPSTFIDYSKPPTPGEIQEIKAAINRLRPDLAHLPVSEPRLCECGHWVFGYYPCCRTSSGTKLN